MENYLNPDDISLIQVLGEDAVVFKIKSLEKTRKSSLGIGGHMKEDFEKGHYVFCSLSKYNEKADTVSVFNMRHNGYRYKTSDLVVVNVSIAGALNEHRKKEYELKIEGRKEREKRIENINILLHQFNKINIENTDFSKSNRLLRTNVPFFQKGIILEDNSFLAYHTIQGEHGEYDILHRDIDNEDVLIFIPEQWANVSGYDEEFIFKWVELISQLCNIEILSFGKQPLPEFGNYNDIDNIYLTKNSFYTFHLNGNDHYMTRYLAFSLMMCLYHHDVNNIPGLTIQLMNYFKKYDFFKCLLIAHSSNIYNFSYGVGVIDTITPIGMSYLTPNPEYDKTQFLKNIIKDKSIISTIERLTVGEESANLLKENFKNKRFDEVLSLLGGLSINKYIKTTKRKPPMKKFGTDKYKFSEAVFPELRSSFFIKEESSEFQRFKKNILPDRGVDSLNKNIYIGGADKFREINTAIKPKESIKF